jgi:F0F1-type ATP synthase delta subunit
MRKTDIKKIANASFTREKLDEVKVKKVAKQLKREDLKVYIRELKDIESRKTVQITVPSEEGLSEMKRYFTKLYPDKKLLFGIDETLIGGIRVVDYDNIYELSIKNFLEGSIEGGLND